MALTTLLANGRDHAGRRDHRHAENGQRCRPALEQQAPPQRDEKKIAEIQGREQAAVGRLVGTAEKQVAEEIQHREAGEYRNKDRRQFRPAGQKKDNCARRAGSTGRSAITSAPREPVTMNTRLTTKASASGLSREQ